MQLYIPDGTVRDMKYNTATQRYEVVYDGTILSYYEVDDNGSLRYQCGNGYALIVDGVAYYFNIRPLKLQRNENGCGIGSDWAQYYDEEEYEVIRHQTQGVIRMQNTGVVISGDMDKNWTMISLDDDTGSLSVVNPYATDGHVLKFEASNEPMNLVVNVEWEEGIEIQGGEKVAFRLHKTTQDGNERDFENTEEKGDCSVDCGEGSTYTGTLSQQKKTTILDTYARLEIKDESTGTSIAASP